jgi:hypothetical protein
LYFNPFSIWNSFSVSFLIPDQIDENLKLALQQDLTSMAPGLVIQVSIATVGGSPGFDIATVGGSPGFDIASSPPRDVLFAQENQGPLGS